MAKPLKIMSVVGARPNFMKIAPFVREVSRHPAELDHTLVHTGQHYDAAMSEAFFEALNIPQPDIDLGIGSGTHAEQVGRTMIEFEKVVQERKPDWIVVVGDVNATCACSQVAKKDHVKLAHIEAGLRSGDHRMPEEINRIVTDRLSDLLLTPDRLADENLKSEGVSDDKVQFVGNIMIDTLDAHREEAERLDVEKILAAHQVHESKDRPPTAIEDGNYALVTLHRPSNVDNHNVLVELMDFLLKDVTKEMPLVWTMHPRTRKQLELFELWDQVLSTDRVHVAEPLGYHAMIRMNMGARVMLTDSGGVQEESCVLGTPCITLRENTERPVTLREHGGTCELAGNDVASISALFDEMKDMQRKPHRPELWDGKTAERIVKSFLDQ